MKFYVSGPMTGCAEFNFPQFARAAEALRHDGLSVLSAHEIKHDEPDDAIGNLPWTTYLRDDLVELVQCDALVLLPGWMRSRGARLELQTALSLEFPIYFYSDATGLVCMNGDQAPGRAGRA